jgi:gamma-glutamylcyclotransferase (GGCT)/AIG2-like uncharacterized protein YtfP
MKKGDLFFVYGTLRRGERADLQKQCRNFGVSFIGVERINGLLYHLGAFPGIKLLTKLAPSDEFVEGLPSVVGEVFRARDTSITAILDAYEGYDADNPTQGLYNRLEVETSEGHMVWVYVYNGPVVSDQLIERGDWCRNREIPVRNRPIRAA